MDKERGKRKEERKRGRAPGRSLYLTDIIHKSIGITWGIGVLIGARARAQGLLSTPFFYA